MQSISDGFDRACALLPINIRTAALRLSENVACRAEELRLRTGYPPTVLADGAETMLPGASEITHRELNSVLELSTGASVHTAQESIRRGFVTVRGGCRVGLCGTAVVQSGGVSTLRELSSVSIRIPSERTGCADELIAEIFGEWKKNIASPRYADGGRNNILIISPPGYGKTTLLRELVRKASESGKRVSLSDERGEIAACWNGKPQLDVGPRTDVITGAPKAEAAMMLLRSMNPQILALDEITDPGDVKICLSAINCGVSLMASAHAESVAELKNRPIFRELLEYFSYVIIICVEGEKRIYKPIKLEAEI